MSREKVITSHKRPLDVRPDAFYRLEVPLAVTALDEKAYSQVAGVVVNFGAQMDGRCTYSIVHTQVDDILECSKNPLHVTGYRLRDLKVELLGNASSGNGLFPDRRFIVMPPATAQRMRASDLAVALEEHDVWMNQSTADIARVEIVMPFDYAVIVEREVIPPAPNECPFCRWGPIVCPACRNICYECPSCKQEIVVARKRAMPSGEQRLIIERLPPWWPTVDLSRWDGSDLFSGRQQYYFATRRMVMWLTAAHLFPFVATPVAASFDKVESERRKAIDELLKRSESL